MMCRKKTVLLFVVFLIYLLNLSSAQEAKEATFTGRVLDAQGRHVAEAIVKFYDGKYTQSLYTTDIAEPEEKKSDINGEFSIIKKSDYPYGHIVVEKAGLALDCAQWNKRESQEIQFRLDPPKELTGTVVDEDGKPVSNAQVAILMLAIGRNEERHLLDSNAASKILSTRTDSTGKFSFVNLPANARVEFLVRKKGYAIVSTFKRAMIPKQSFQFSPGQKDIKIILPVESNIEGVVLDKDSGKPVAGVNLLLRDSQNYTVYGQDLVTSGDNGAFTIDGISAGSYNVLFALPREGLPEWVAQPVSVTLDAGQTIKDVKIELGKGGFLEVLVTESQTDKPLKGAAISFRNEQSRQSFSSKTDEGGIARLRLLPGVYRSAYAYLQGYSSFNQQDAITVEEGSTKRLKWQLTAQPKVTGVVRDENGKPIKGVELGILPGGNRNIESDAQGNFEISWNPGRFPGEERENPLLVCRYVEGNLTTVVIIAEGAKTLDVKLRPGITVTGKIVDPNSRGIEDAQVGMMLRQTMWSSTFIRRDSIKTDAGGNFEIKAVPSEHRYELNVSADGYGGEQKELHADDAVDNRLDIGTITLPVANLTVSGIVVDIEGNPLANTRIESYNYEGGQPDRLMAQTDSQGKFTLEGVCEGQINLRVNANQADKRLSARVITDGGASDIKIVVREGRSVTQYIRMKNYDQVIRSAEKVIAGVVVDENGSPVEGVPVCVCCKKIKRENGKFMWSFGGYENLSDTTDKQGRFVIELQEDAEYNMRFSPDNHAALIVYDIPVGEKDLKVVLPEGGTITGQLVRMERGQKVPISNVEVKLEQESRASYTHLGFDRDRTAVTDAQGRFQFVHVRTKIRPGGSRSEEQWKHVPRVWLLSYGDTSKSVTFYDGTTMDDIELLVSPTRQQQTLTGIALPPFDGIKINLAEEQTKGKRMLVCFWDMNQRPSRNCLIQLNKRAKELQEKDIIVVAVQSSKVDDGALNEWIKNQNISFPVGMIEVEEKDMRLAWGVKFLPWMILTNAEHIVTSEGFSMTELNETIEKNVK